jgi:hypothetical protein
MMRSFLLISALAACGGGVKPAPVAHDEHANMPPELVKFHDVLAPRWHADKGPDRMKRTCDAMLEFTQSATAIAVAQPANVDRDAWTNGAGKLAASLQDLDATCKANDAAKFETAFEQVHVSFHGLLEAAGGEHREEHEM